MGHGKLRKFAENETFACLVQPAAEEVLSGRGREFALKDHPLKGHWNEKMFDAPRPIVLELGCGRGEYTIDLARRNPDYNYIGVDIKGARLWRGAKEATLSKMGNVAFLRTRIEFIPAFFAPSEVAEIWLTFSDPQLHHENSRLSSPLFLKRYREFLAPGGLIHLKTDSMFLHQYTLALCRENSFPILARSEDLYTDIRESRRARLGGAEALSDAQVDAIFEVHTYYETMFSRQGYRITYLCFCPWAVGQPEGFGPVRACGAIPPNQGWAPPVHEATGGHAVQSPQADQRHTWASENILSPSSFDADYWRSVEGPRHSVALPDL